MGTFKIKLMDLEPQFVRYEVRRLSVTVANDPKNFPVGGTHEEMRDVEHHVHVDSMPEAQGISFLCPKCFFVNGGARRTHRVLCWSRSRGVPDSAMPGPGRWTLAGTGYADLTLNGDPPGKSRSVLLTSGCEWHGHITNGEAT